MTTASHSFTGVKAQQQRTWAAGDYVKIGNSLVLMAELLCEAVDLRAGSSVLDIATGSGNTALAAARRHCVVTGLDYVPGLVEKARRRADAEELPVRFDVADAEDLPFADASFDVVLSTIGVMFAPDHSRAAAEMLRVCRSGGTLGLTCWTPEGFAGDFFALHGKYVPPPADVDSPLLWGMESRLAALLGERITRMRVVRKEHVFRFPSVSEHVRWYQSYFGPSVRTLEQLPPEQRSRFTAECEALLRRRNTAEDGTVVLPAEYLEVVAVRA